MDKDGKAHYVLSGTWDEKMEFSRVMQSSRRGENGTEGKQKTVYQTLKARELWKRNPLPWVLLLRNLHREHLSTSPVTPSESSQVLVASISILLLACSLSLWGWPAPGTCSRFLPFPDDGFNRTPGWCLKILCINSPYLLTFSLSWLRTAICIFIGVGWIFMLWFVLHIIVINAIEIWFHTDAKEGF